MFSFFRRNKSRSQEVNNASSNNNENTGNVVTPSQTTKLSVNMQLAIERQQASLAAVLEQKRSQNDVNGREQKEHVKNEENNPPVTNYRSPTTSSSPSAIVNEYDRSNALSNLSGSARASQNFDPHRDSKRVPYSPFDLFVSSRQTSIAPSHNLSKSASDHLTTRSIASSSSSPSINEQQKLQNLTKIAGTGSTLSSTQFDEVMARGRNKNRNNRPSNFSSNNNNNNKNIVKNNKNSGDNKVQNNTLERSSQVNDANENKITRNENVPHATHSTHASDDDENSCSINSTTDNTNDNITVLASDEKTVKIPSRVSAAAADDTGVNGGDDDEKNCAAAGYEKEQMHQQVRRVTFAPSPLITTRSRTASLTSLADDDEQVEEEEEETVSEDIFYEAPTTISESNDTQKLRILSTVTSHSCNDEESSASTLTKTTSNNDGNNNDVVCAKIILSVNENCNENDSNDDDIAFSTSSNRGNEINSEENSISNDNDEKESSPPLKTIKSSYKLVGDEAVALPDILDSALPDILCEQQSHHNIDANV